MPSLLALLKNGDGGSVHEHYPPICCRRCIVKAMRSSLRDPGSGGANCLHLCMPRKQITLAGEDYEIISLLWQELLSARSVQLRSKCAPGVLSHVQFQRIYYTAC